jgi:hypothetical protein
MKRQVLTIGLLTLFLALLFVPGYPLLSYYIIKSHVTISNADIRPETTNSLIGDLHYLQALIERSVDCDNTKKIPETPPSTQNQTTNVVYLLSVNIIPLSENSVFIDYTPYRFTVKDCFIMSGNPPPEV